MSAPSIAITASNRTTKAKLVSVWLTCGIVASLLYVAMNVFVPLQWRGYSFASQVISELSAIDAPTRSLWVPLGIATSCASCSSSPRPGSCRCRP